MHKLHLICVGLLSVAIAAHAAGPETIARSNRSLWPDDIQSAAGFDRASRAELLAFGHQLAATEKLSDDAWRVRLRLKVFGAEHFTTMRDIYWQRISRNYAVASAHCSKSEPFCPTALDVESFKQASSRFDAPTDERYRSWFENAATFHRVYLDEMLRLAALFPRITSEVDTFEADEFTGSEFGDRQFFLTFDDGPTAVEGNTDKLLAVLRHAHMDATFFVLGGNLDVRAHSRGAVINRLYEGMCVGMHGWEHKSHSSWAQWQDSVTKTTALVRNQLPVAYVPFFRPPYGQRTADSGKFFAEHGLKVALWNIDSQDWNKTISSGEVGQRVLTLMLLWRHGIILFHDVRNKAQSAVQYLVAQTQRGNVIWEPCRALTSVTSEEE